MTTPTPEPSAFARERLDELIGCGCIVEVLAITKEGAMLLLMDGETPVFIPHATDTPRSELSKQTFIVRECAQQSFQRFMRSQLDEDFRLQLMH